MSEMCETVRRDSAPELMWKCDSANENAKAMKSRVLMASNKDNCPSDVIDMNGNYSDKFCCDENEKFSEDDKENLNRFVSSTNYGGNDSDLCKGKCDDDCRNGDCRRSLESVAKLRRNSTSDLHFRASDLFSNPNSIAMRRSSILGGSGKSLEKTEKINLANLVFNPNFKNPAGCVNLPVIRAGQNLAQKNAQRSAAKEGLSSNKDLAHMTQQAALDLLARQLQPQSLDKLTQKLQQFSAQRKPNNAGSQEEEQQTAGPFAGGLGTNDDIIQTFTGKSQQVQTQPPQGNALRYKTELCRSYEEGGECRFGSACTFAHGAEELRPVPRHPLYKTELCRTYHQHGYCQYGTRCHFIHDADEADKNAPLKGCKSWGRHDQLSGALLSLASSSGLLDSAASAKQAASSSDNDVLLANLRRLYALRVMNGQEKSSDLSNQFSMSQPMSQQLSMAHQQLAAAGMQGSQHLPLSMTQPLPMDALHMGMQRAAGQVHPYHQRTAGQMYPHMASNSRLESLVNDYSSWGVPPPSPTYSGVSPFGNYHQQFSPLPHHQTSSSSYPGYPYSFSATAPDLSAALNSVSPYGMTPQSFSNTVNVGHYLQDPSANYAAAAAASANYQKNCGSSNSQAQGGGATQGVLVGGPNPVWPQTSAEVSSAIDNELFGFGLDSQQNSGNFTNMNKSGGGSSGHPMSSHQYQHPYFQSMAAYQQQMPQQSQGAGQVSYSDHAKYAYQNNGSSAGERTTETDLLSLLQGGNNKYASGKDSRTLRTINESSDSADESVRPKTRTSLSNVKLN